MSGGEAMSGGYGVVTLVVVGDLELAMDVGMDAAAIHSVQC